MLLQQMPECVEWDLQIAGSRGSVAAVLFPNGEHDRPLDTVHERRQIFQNIEIRHRHMEANRALELNYVHVRNDRTNRPGIPSLFGAVSHHDDALICSAEPVEVG